MNRLVASTCALLTTVTLALWAPPARADSTVVHVVRPGETLASIAQLYYGDPRREGALVAENGLGSEGGSSIVVGLRLVIPTVSYHVVVAGESWAALAEHYYGDPRRSFVLSDANANSGGKQPDVGAEILVPYPLRYFGSAHDPLRQAAKEFFDGSNTAIQVIRRFNSLKTSRATRGAILLLPLDKLVLSDKGRKLTTAQAQAPEADGEMRAKQLRIHDELPTLHGHVLRGRYVEAVAMANRLVGVGDLTGNQIVSIQRELGTALIALDRDDLARQAFMLMLEKQPDVELGIGTTSPKLLRVLEDAKKALAAAHAATAAAAAAKALPAPATPTPSVAAANPQAAETNAKSDAPSQRAKPARR